MPSRAVSENVHIVNLDLSSSNASQGQRKPKAAIMETKPQYDLQSQTRHDTIELETREVPLTVDGRYLGHVNPFTGVICLHYRGKREWYSLKELRKQLTD